MPMLGACVQPSAPRGQIGTTREKMQRDRDRDRDSDRDKTQRHTCAADSGHERAQSKPRGPREDHAAVPPVPCRAVLMLLLLLLLTTLMLVLMLAMVMGALKQARGPFLGAGLVGLVVLVQPRISLEIAG